MKEIQLTQGKIALVDDEDYEWLNQWKWCAQTGPSCDYAVRTSGTRKSRKRISMHRLILGVQDGSFVDHINGNGLDNRRVNLRECTKSQNGCNRKRSANNTSGFKGVYVRGSKWRSQIRINGQDIHLGTFDSIRDAIRAYDNAAVKYHGEFARLNS